MTKQRWIMAAVGLTVVVILIIALTAGRGSNEEETAAADDAEAATSNSLIVSSEEEDKAGDSSPKEAAPLTYKKGWVNQRGFKNEFLDLSLMVPAGYSMASEAELNALNEIEEGSDVDWEQKMVVYEMVMHSSAHEVNHTVHVKAERLEDENTTARQYLEEQYLWAGFAQVDFQTYPISIAGQDYVFVLLVRDNGSERHVYARKAGDRMLSIVIDAVNTVEASLLIFLLNQFHTFSEGGSLEG